MKTKAKKIDNGVYTFKTYGYGNKMIVLSNFTIKSFDSSYLFIEAFRAYLEATGIDGDRINTLTLDNKIIFKVGAK